MRPSLVPVGTSVRLNLTPMIDVTFQLILFFLLAGHMAQQESSYELDLPTAQTGQRMAETDTRRLVINIAPDGQIVLSGERVSLGRLEEILRAEAKGQDEPVEVRIRTDRAVPYGTVSPILVLCAKNGLWNVSFSVIGGEEER